MRKEGTVEEPVLEDEQEEVVSDIEKEGDDEISGETPEESVRAAIKEIQEAQVDGGEGSEEEAPPAEVEKEPVAVKAPAEKKKAVKAPADDEAEPELDPDLTPPERLKAHEKELFRKIPNNQKWVKKFISRTVKELEGAMTRATTEASRARDEASSIVEAVKPYVDQFTVRKLPIGQGLAQLCLAQKKLTDTSNPKLQKETWLAIGRDIGMDVSLLEDEGDGAAPDIANHPYVKSLEAKINGLQERIEPVINQNKQARDSQESQLVEKATSELEDVISETDASGRFIRPELQKASFFESWKPLVSALIRNENLSYRDAGVEAYNRMTGRSSNKSIQTRIPATNSNLSSRQVSAAVSVRGHKVPAALAVEHDDDEVPSNETPEQSVRRALASLSRG